MRCLPLVCCLTGCGRFAFDDATVDAARPPDAQLFADGNQALPDCHVTHPTALICEGFENGMDGWDYAVVDFGTVNATPTRAYRGSYAFEAVTDSSPNYKTARWGKFYPSAITSGDLYVREYLYLSTSLESQVSLMVTGNGATPFPSTYFSMTPTENHIQVDQNPFSFAPLFPQNKWTCVELHIVIDSTFGVATVTFDGNTLTTGMTNTAVAGGYTNVDVGVHYTTDTQPTVSLWVDEVVVDTSPIGCD